MTILFFINFGRLNFLHEFIPEQQSGFQPKRQLKDYVSIVLDVIEYLQQHNEKQILDAGKGFDYLNWKLLEFLMKKMKDSGTLAGFKINKPKRKMSRQFDKKISIKNQQSTNTLQTSTWQGR